MDPQILYEDTHLLVCRKEAGIPTQSCHVGTPDMVSILKNYLYKSSPTKKEPYLGIIHRLDQPVEGILVFAKTPFAAKEMSRQLQQFGFGKHYRALLCAIPPKPEDTLEHYLLKDGRINTSSVCDPHTPGAKKARLHYKITETLDKTVWIHITLETGRHHQIRVQMAAIGCPIAGDTKYRLADFINTDSHQKLELCAYRLDFKHPKTKKDMSFEI